MLDPIKRQRTQNEFGAPWGRAVTLTTGLVVGVIIVGLIAPQLAFSDRPEAGWARWLVPAAVLTVFGVTSLFSVRGFVVKGRELWILRTLWCTRFPLRGLKEAHADPAAMKRSFRTAGNGGFLAFTGWFRNKKLGSYRAFVTDPARCVVMQFRDRTLVVSPHDPEGFLEALGFGTHLNRTRH